jgi:hypothetical protein
MKAKNSSAFDEQIDLAGAVALGVSSFICLGRAVL